MLNRDRLVHAIPLLLAASPRTAIASGSETLPGFSAERVEWQQQFEEQFKKIPDAAQAEELITELSSHPILVATNWDEWNARRVAGYLRRLGFEPDVHTYYPYVSKPRQIQVEIIEPTQRVLATKEQAWPWQEHFDDVVAAYNAYTPAGDVTADLVYVNYGLPADYDRLAQLGVEVRGKIAIARYGHAYRGVKNQVAHERGTVGLLLFDDPSADGFLQGDVYPLGPWRSPDGIQRGTIEHFFRYPGDPLTPGWAATEHAHRLAPSQAANLPTGTPTTPIGYGDAAYLLESLDGNIAPEDWQGGLADPRWATFGRTPFAYRLGGTGHTLVHLKVDVEYANQAIRDIVVRVPGAKFPDQVVLVGAHRDGWAYGTSDNTVGLVAVLETARALKTLADQGWRPDRTILVAAWDGEEYGMLGSTEWGEEFQQELAKNLVGYINVDAGGGSQYFYAAGVPALDDLVYDISKQVTVPGETKSVYDHWVEQSGGAAPAVDREGSGSDFAVFLDFLGVPVVDLGFYSDNGNYHSTQDDLFSLETWGDPGLAHLVGTAQLAGLAALRLANADVLPLVYSRYAAEVSDYLAQLETAFPQSPVSLERLKTQAEEWRATALDWESKIDHLLSCGGNAGPRAAATLRRINERLMTVERRLTRPNGLPQRPWHKHMIYAPSLESGYAVEYLPALRDAFTAGDWDGGRRYAQSLGASLAEATQALRLTLPDGERCGAGAAPMASTRSRYFQSGGPRPLTAPPRRPKTRFP